MSNGISVAWFFGSWISTRLESAPRDFPWDVVLWLCIRLQVLHAGNYLHMWHGAITIQTSISVPEIYTWLHAVSMSKQSSYFNSVSTHMALEKSLNKNSKTKCKTSILHLRYNTSSKHTFFLRLCSRKTFSLVMLVETEMSGRDSRLHLRTISALLLKNFSKTIVIQETKFVSINHSFI